MPGVTVEISGLVSLVGSLKFQRIISWPFFFFFNKEAVKDTHAKNVQRLKTFC